MDQDPYPTKRGFGGVICSGFFIPNLNFLSMKNIKSLRPI
jgi:hypothetical protein